MVTCNLLSVELDATQDRRLRCVIESDLPPGTRLDVMVYRTYLDKHGDLCSWNMDISACALLSELPNGHSGAVLEFPVDDFDRNGHKFFRKMEGAARAIKRGVSDDVQVDVFLGLGNGLPRLFGRNNRELNGDIVFEHGQMRTVQTSKAVSIPLAPTIRDAVGPVVRTRQARESEATPSDSQEENLLFRKAALLLDRGKPERVEQLLRSAIALAEAHGNVVTEVQARSCYGEWLHEVGRQREARSQFRAILNLRGECPIDDLEEFEWAEQRLLCDRD